MEQPSDSSDGLQPQELSSTCSFPRAFDLTKNSEECLFKSNPIEALHVVQPPGWYLSSGTSNGSALPEDQTDPSPQPTEQIQSDDALSNTTVTLSYVTRSHVFSAHDSLSQHSQIYNVPISKAFSLHPTAYDASQLVTDAGGAPLCVEMDQHCLQQVSVPVGLATCASPFDFVTPAQVMENVANLCYLQQAHNISDIQDVESLALETLRTLQQNNPSECKIPLNLDEIQNGAIGSLWNAGAIDGSFSAEHVETMMDQHKNGNPEVLFLISRTDEPVLLANDQEPADLTLPLNQEFISALEDSVSPAFASLIGVKDVSILPQTAGSQSDDNVLEEETNTRQYELSNVESDPLTSVEDGDSSSATNASSTVIIGQLTEDTADTSITEQSEQTGTLSEVQEEETHAHNVTHKKTHLPGRLPAKKETLVRKVLPPRTRRGMRLEAIVQNIFPSRYKSCHVSRAKKSLPPDNQPDQTTHLGSSPNVSFGNNDSNVLEEECPLKVGTEPNEKAAQSHAASEEMDPSKISTSCSKTVSKQAVTVPARRLSHKPIKRVRKSKKGQKRSNSSTGRIRTRTAPLTPKPTSKPTKGLLKHKTLTKSSKSSKSVKKGHAPKKKRRKHKVGQSSMFSQQEPEIKLRYISYKDEKKEKRDETFSPFVHVDLKAYPTCTVINYPDESTRLSRGKKPAPVVTGKIPSTPCLQHGRVSMEGTRWNALVCCLCGGSANAMDLGDLHGPYYPEGYKSEARLSTNPQGPRQGDSSDSDSSSSRSRKPRHKLQAAALGPCKRWSTDAELCCSPEAKRSRTDTVTDWFAPPIVPLEASEYWLHEDCGIWSAGVFLVRGKLYGLEKAVKTAKETICSACQKTGATLGCFFKGCPNKYHYICAMQSGCVLYEENFSMKCRKHKNKSIKGVSSNRQNSR